MHRQQGHAILEHEFPDADDHEIQERWNGGQNYGGIYNGCKVVQTRMIKKGSLIGFCRALITTHEIYIDEIIIENNPDARRKGYATRLIAAILEMTDAEQIRLQVRSSNKKARALYEEVLYMRPWQEPREGRYVGVGPSEDLKETMIMKVGGKKQYKQQHKEL